MVKTIKTILAVFFLMSSQEGMASDRWSAEKVLEMLETKIFSSRFEFVEEKFLLPSIKELRRDQTGIIEGFSKINYAEKLIRKSKAYIEIDNEIDKLGDYIDKKVLVNAHDMGNDPFPGELLTEIVKYVDSRVKAIKTKVEKLKKSLPSGKADLTSIALKLYKFECPSPVVGATWKAFKKNRLQKIDGKEFEIDKESLDSLPNDAKLSLGHSLTKKEALRKDETDFIYLAPYHANKFQCKYKYKSKLSGTEYTLVLEHLVRSR